MTTEEKMISTILIKHLGKAIESPCQQIYQWHERQWQRHATSDNQLILPVVISLITIFEQIVKQKETRPSDEREQAKSRFTRVTTVNIWCINMIN